MDYYIYQHVTRAGTVSLIPEAGGRYKVMFNDENLGSYASAESAVDDLSGGYTTMPSSGIDLGDLGIPNDLGDWQKKLFTSISRLRPS